MNLAKWSMRKSLTAWVATILFSEAGWNSCQKLSRNTGLLLLKKLQAAAGKFGQKNIFFRKLPRRMCVSAQFGVI
jgi:hypothetical protein